MSRLYSLVVKDSTPTPYVPPPDGEMWYLRHAALPSNASVRDYASLSYRNKDSKEWIPLGTMRPDHADFMSLDLSINEYVEFQVKGTMEVYLTGSLVVEDDNPIFDSDDEAEPTEEMLRAMMNGGQNEVAESDSEEKSEEESESIAVEALKKQESKRKEKNEKQEAEPAVEERKKESTEATGLTKSQAKRLKKKQKRKAIAAASEELEQTAKQQKVHMTPTSEIPTDPPSKIPTPSKSGDPKRKRIRRFSNGFVIENLAYGAEEGEGVGKGKTVTIKYEGRLADGTVFDKTHGDATFSFDYGKGEVVKGLDKGMDDMKVGDKRRLKVPSKMGYGVTGALPAIPANADLTFDVELLKIE